MKSLVPCLCLLASSIHLAHADNGLTDYRSGHYFQAAQELLTTPSKDALANDYLANMSLYGYGQLKNNAMALRYLQASAEKGLLTAQRHLALIALLQEKNPEKALIWFKKAAEANDRQAQMYTAAAYLFGYGTKKNPEIAKRYYIAAARNGDSIAQCTLAKDFLSNRQGKSLGMIWLNKALTENNPQAQMLMGQIYSNGQFVPQDLNKAKELLGLAVAQAYVPAMVQMGLLLQKQNDLTQAKEWFNKAAMANDSLGEKALADLYLQEKSPLHDDHLGFLWMLKAAQHGLPEAQIAMANLYKNGSNGVNKDENLAKEWQQKAQSKERSPGVTAEVQAARWLSNNKADDFAASGYRLKGILSDWQNPEALKQNRYNQAPSMPSISRETLYQPQFVMVAPNDITIADYYDAIASVLGESLQEKTMFPRYALDKEALNENSTTSSSSIPSPMLAQREEVVPDSDILQSITEQKVKYLQRRAVLGDPGAQLILGELYQRGLGVDKNIQEAIKNYELASAQQELRAEYQLGLIYLEGEGVPADYTKATNLLKDAAFKGNDYAQYALARLAELGFKDANDAQVISPDHEQAIAMYNLAAANDNGLAQYRLAELLVRDKPTDLSVGTKIARQDLIKHLYQSAYLQGIKAAALPLAFFNAMENDKAKQSNALAVAKEEAKAGRAGAALLLGLMYDRGIGVPVDRSEAIDWYQQAPVTPVNAFIMGTYFSQGTGVSKDLDKAANLLQEAANAGLSYAHLNLAILKHEQSKDFLPELKQALAMGNSKAGLLLADYYLSQANGQEEMQKAREIYQHFAEQGDKEGQVKLGFMLEKALGGSVDLAAAKKWYEAAAQQGQALAQYLLAELYQLGDATQQVDYAEAKKWYQQSAKNFPPAAIALGFIYDTVDADYEQALASYQQAANQGLGLGQLNLALIYELGKGRPVDYSSAAKLYQAAAEQGVPQAMVQLAGLYLQGQGVSQDESDALSWYKKAAEAGDQEASYQLGLMSELGMATKVDMASALHDYQVAAEKGNAKAKLALARIYQQGIGVAQDKQQALDYYKQLASEGNPFAQYQLAMSYYSSENNKHMPAEGKLWLVRARDNGSAEANRMLQWLDAQVQERTSFIEPVLLNPSPDMAQR
jgi:enhanced entry protein EnhC